MKKLLYRYLSSVYVVRGNKIQTIIGPPKAFGLNAVTVINDLKKVFNLNKSEIKWLLKGWIKTQNKGFDFNKFWKKKLSSFLGGTFSTGLLTVQPMAAPNIGNFYLDYVCGMDLARMDVLMGQPIGISSRRETIEEELMKENVRRMAEHYVNIPIYYDNFPIPKLVE